MYFHFQPTFTISHRLRKSGIHALAVGKTGRGAGVGVGDQWVKPGDRELGDHVTKLCFHYKLD